MPAIIDVVHQCSNGWHKFSSPHIPGFYMVAEQNDLEEVYSEIPSAIAALIAADFGMDVKLRVQTSYSAYLEELPEEYRPSVSHYVIEELMAA